MGHKIVADPKNIMSVTSSKAPATLEQLAEVEKNILNMLRMLEDEYVAKGGASGESDAKVIVED
jgi:hypothetical protein